ncbi:MAG: phosphoglycerate dehydrogenase [Spirochaetota bacterium]
MYTIRTMNKIAEKGLSLLPADDFQVSDDAANPDAILVRSAKLHDETFADNLQAIARAGAGVNNIPIDRCSERGIVVFNTPGANANSVKELVLAGMLLSARGIHEGMSWVQENAGLDDLEKVVEKEKKRFAGIELMGKTLGVVGLGAIGVMVSNAATALGMRVIGFDPFISVESAWGLSRAVERASSLEQLLASCDYITLHVPLNDTTKGMIGVDEFAAMKPGSRLLNFARGGLVDDSALIEALNEGKLARYVTDFPGSKVAGHERVLPLPHLGASTEEAEENCAIMAARQLRDYLEQGTIVNSVNFPECRLDPTANQRILIANRNIPNMVGQVTTILANHSINILNLLNRHRGELAYNIIDIDRSVAGEAVEQLRAVDGVIFVRTIQPVLR